MAISNSSARNRNGQTVHWRALTCCCINKMVRAIDWSTRSALRTLIEK